MITRPRVFRAQSARGDRRPRALRGRAYATMPVGATGAAGVASPPGPPALPPTAGMEAVTSRYCRPPSSYIEGAPLVGAAERQLPQLLAGRAVVDVDLAVRGRDEQQSRARWR